MLLIKIFYSIVFGLIRTPALVYFVLSGVLIWIVINLISLILKPFQFLLSNIVFGRANMPGAGIVTFALAIFIYRTMYRLSLSVFTAFFPYQIMIPYPVPLRPFLETTNKISSANYSNFFPIDANIYPSFLVSFLHRIDASGVAFMLMNIPIRHIDLMIIWVITLASFGYLLSNLVRYVLYMADLH